MKITCISDIHGHLIDISKTDLLLIAGDVLPLNIQSHNFESVKWLQGEFSEWAESIDAKEVIMIPGNHDFVFEQMTVAIDGVKVLIDNYTTFEGLKIWGSPWQLWFCDFAFNAPKIGGEEFLQKKYDLIPDDTDIILSHGPPYGLCDKTIGGKLTGSKSLTNRIFDKTFTKLSAVVCGHIHEANGVFCLGDHVMADGHNCDIVNCSILDENYRVKNKPWEFVL